MSNIAKILLFFAFLSGGVMSQSRYDLQCDSLLLEKSKIIMFEQIGVREATGRNDGFEVEMYLSSVNRKKGDAYCAAGQYWCFYSAALALDLPLSYIPLPKSGVANAFFNYAKKHGIKKKYIPSVHCLLIWKKDNSFSGHVERIIEVGKKGWVTTIGFNTSSGNKGSQNDGQGVYQRKRNIGYCLGRMKVRGLVGFRND